MTAFPGQEARVARVFCALTVLCALSVLAPAARSQSLPLYTVSRDDDKLRTVEPLTGMTLTSTPIALTVGGNPVTVLFANGLAKNPLTGELFAILSISGQTTRELVKLNPTTDCTATSCVATDVGNTLDFFAGITFDANGTLYGVTGDGGTNPETLFTLSTTTGAATQVTTLGNGDNGETIAFDPVDGLIYHASGLTTQVFETLNPASPFAVTDIPQSGDVHSEATGLAHWAGNFFLLADADPNDTSHKQLFLFTNTGQARFLSSVNHVIKGMVFAGTPPATCPPAAGTLFGAANQGPNGPSLFYRIDPTTAAPTLVGPIGFELVGAMAFNGTGTLYGTGERMDGTDTNVLLTINPCTGAGTEVGATGIEASGFTRVSDISFRHSDGTLFAELLGNTGGELATINTSTGQATLVGVITATPGSGNALAFSPSDTLFQADSANLNTIDPATGTPSLAATLTFSAPAGASSRVNAMDFQPSTGTLFGAVNNKPLPSSPAENYLGTINTATGVVTLVSTTQTQGGLDAIAFSTVPTADLALSKADAPDPVIEGDNLTYTLRVTNNGPSGATAVTLTDPLPAAVTFVSASTSQGSCSQASGTVTCNLGNIASAAQVTVTIVVRPTGAASLSNTASVTATESDPNPANNSATATGTSLGFTLSNTTGTVTVNAGQTARFTIRVTPGAGGFPNAITFAASNLPAQTTASFNPPSATPGNSAVDVTFSLATTAPANLPPPSIPLRGPWPVSVPLLTACALLLLWFFMRRQGTQFRRPLALLPLAALLFCAASFFGCNGHTPTGGTPAGTYDVTVTATSGTASHTQTVTLIVR